MADLALLVKRTVRAPVQRVFDAWTRPDLLVRWWGPPGVTCPQAEVDLRVGGAYAIANQTPNGVVWIRGQFVEVDAPAKLVYTWVINDAPPDSQRVTVRFEPVDDHTMVTVVHERIEDPSVRESHQQGWVGCLDGLARLFEV
jgi:uncharacterized protein YndB with AHSA1/START domain